jgi:O-antigen/teichoic acid export membrane protein
VPNALGIVMFSRAVDPRADAGRVASVLTRSTLAVAIVMAVPTFIVGPRFVRFVYGTQFADAGVALRFILPGVVAYSVVAVLTRYITGRGRPGTMTLIMLLGLAVNITANLILIPRMSINGAALASSISYGVTALVTLVVFRRLSGRGLAETILVRPSDLRAVGRAVGAVLGRLRGRRAEPVIGLAGEEAADMVIDEHEPGSER